MGTTIKRTIGTLLTLVLFLTACGGGPPTGGGQDPTSAPPPVDTSPASDDAPSEEVADAAVEAGSVTAATLEQMRSLNPEALATAHDHSGHSDHNDHDDHRHADLPNSVEPERIVIDSIGVDADIIDLGYEDNGEIEVPSDFSQTGWFTDSPRPGRVGSSVIAGHVDSRDGPAVFFRLTELEVGDEIEIHGEDGDVVTFRVTRREQHAKSAFPAEEVHRSTGKPELKLVTCGGVFDADERSYRDNIIVSAERVDH